MHLFIIGEKEFYLNNLLCVIFMSIPMDKEFGCESHQIDNK